MERRTFRLLRGHYSSFFAPTDSFASLSRLSSTSALPRWRSLCRLSTSPCCPPDLPDVISEDLSCDAWAPITTVLQIACTCFFLCNSGLPHRKMGRLYRKIPLKRLHSGRDFRDCSHFFMFRPHILLATLVAPTTTVSRRAVSDFYIRAERASLPPHAPNMLAV